MHGLRLALRTGALLILLGTLSACSPVEGGQGVSASPAGLNAYDPGLDGDDEESYAEGGQGEMIVPFEILDTPHKAAPSEDSLTYYRQQTEYYQSYSQCMEERGWGEQEILEPYSPLVAIRFNDWWLDRERYIEEGKECFATVGPQPMPPELTLENALVSYELAKSGHACLRNLGANVQELPSKQKYVDSFIEGYPWFPWADDGPANDPLLMKYSYSELYAKCPW